MYERPNPTQCRPGDLRVASWSVPWNGYTVLREENKQDTARPKPEAQSTRSSSFEPRSTGQAQPIPYLQNTANTVYSCAAVCVFVRQGNSAALWATTTYLDPREGQLV